MRPTFAIFTMLPDGRPFWIESVETLEAARACLREVARNAPGNCFIYSAKSGVVELIIHSELQERLSPHSSHVVQKGQASKYLRRAVQRSRRTLGAKSAPTNLPHR
jgi:hypothetical protein